MTPAEIVNCVKSLFRPGDCVHITRCCVGTEGKWARACLRDNKCYYCRQRRAREKYITSLGELNVLWSRTLDRSISTSVLFMLI